ncbi:sulfotransferase family protein [Corallibacter sp.]|uniref:sulfotransferase family protein n=1 Tax=Corallibacter sp. TaxID=2038084 RepID=UPI003AB3262C
MTRFNKHVIVVGSARSGTSWLSETLAQPYRYRMLFEPEQETRTKKGHLVCDKWLMTKSDVPKAYRYLKRVFQNRVDCNWIAQNSNRRFKRHLWPFIPKKFIIKFVRANLAAMYLTETFQIPVIHIIRNPYEVLRSQQQVKFPWLYDLSHFVNQPHLVKLIQETFHYDITQYQSLSPIEILAIRWCIENVLPIDIFTEYQSKINVIRYEDLVLNIEEFYKLCENYNLKPVENLQEFYKQPSSKTHPESTRILKNRNKKHFSENDIGKINSIFDVFNVTLYPRAL